MRTASSSFLRTASLTMLAVWSVAPAGITTLAPEEEGFVAKSDLVVSFYADYEPGQVRRARLFFDAEDVTSKTRFTGSTIIFVPDRSFAKRPDIVGPHTVTMVAYGPYREKLESKSIRFYVVENDTVPDKERTAMMEKGKTLHGVEPLEFVNNGTVYLGLAYEKGLDSGSVVGSADAYGNGYAGDAFYSYNLSLSTDEDKNEQTLQRFRLGLGYGTYVRASVGDNWPLYNRFVLNGQRVRGIELNLHAPKGIAGLDFAWGRSRRAVAPYVYNRSDLDSAARDTVLRHNDSIPYFADGTFQRSVLASRLSFGSGRLFSLGLTVLKAKDASRSIDQIVETIAHGDTLDTILVHEPPKDNLAAGADIVVNLWKRRICLYADYALSFLTRNIMGGTFTEEELFRATGDSSWYALVDKYRGLIILNGNTLPLPIPTDTSHIFSGGAVVNSMSWDAGFKLNLPIRNVREMLEFQYFFVGPNYASLGYENLVVDRTGFLVTEDIGILQEKVHLRGTFKYQKDNLNEAKSASTRTLAFGLLGTLSWDRRAPTVTAYFNSSNDKASDLDSSDVRRENGLSVFGASVQYSLAVGSSVNTVSLSYSNAGTRTWLHLTALTNQASTMRMHTIVADWRNRGEESSVEPRIQVGTNISQGGPDFSLVSLTSGLTWYARPEVLNVNADITFAHSQMKDASSAPARTLKRDEWKVKSSVAYYLSKRHSFYGEAGLRLIAKVSSAMPAFRLSYELRY